ncbi:MAG TPA: FprA family A-type flavoprotein [Chitinivibrionales bacterium]|jgi:flavorubredoxin|nr:FprA family A-type flavoprotein [Chitinivibrionales bacterium]
MKMRTLKENVYFGGAIDWDRRLFDSLIPLPDGTSYNSYLVKGSEKTALIDTVDPAKSDTLMDQLAGLERLDYLVAHHAEQDHAGSIPHVLAKYPGAKLLASPKGKGLIVDHLHVDESRITAVGDGETVSLGNRTLRFVHTPWVHWPETMVTYLAEEKILFTCDFFGSHLATTDMYAHDESRVYEAAKRYYAEIMMPFRHTIRSNLEKLKGLSIDIIAPSHGPAYDKPAFIMDAYKDWIADDPKNQVVIPYVSMHGSTRLLVERLVGSLAQKGITVFQFDLAATDLGKLAIALVDAATIVAGTPTVHVGPHPAVLYAATLANALRPKALFASVVGSYGWAGKAAEQIVAALPNLKVEVLSPVMCKGMPRLADFEAVENLAATIFEKHKTRGLVR